MNEYIGPVGRQPYCPPSQSLTSTPAETEDVKARAIINRAKKSFIMTMSGGENKAIMTCILQLVFSLGRGRL